MTIYLFNIVQIKNQNVEITKKSKKMKIQLELNIPGDGRKFLNFWDFRGGDDVCCEVREGKLFLSVDDNDGNPLPKKEISLETFIQLVESAKTN